MRHRNRKGKLSRPTGARKSLVRNLMINLIEHESIRTTEAKAKALRPLIEKMITLGKKGGQHERRLAFSKIGKKEAVHKLFEEIAPRYKERSGGYTRIVRDGQRMGDGSWMAYIMLVGENETSEPEASSADSDAPEQPQVVVPDED